MGLSVHAASTIGSLTQIFLWMEKMQQVNKRKEERRRKFKEKHRRQAIRIERRGIERRFKGQKEERKWAEEKGK